MAGDFRDLVVHCDDVTEVGHLQLSPQLVHLLKNLLPILATLKHGLHRIRERINRELLRELVLVNQVPNLADVVLHSRGIGVEVVRDRVIHLVGDFEEVDVVNLEVRVNGVAFDGFHMAWLGWVEVGSFININRFKELKALVILLLLKMKIR